MKTTFIIILLVISFLMTILVNSGCEKKDIAALENHPAIFCSVTPVPSTKYNGTEGDSIWGIYSRYSKPDSVQFLGVVSAIKPFSSMSMTITAMSGFDTNVCFAKKGIGDVDKVYLMLHLRATIFQNNQTDPFQINKIKVVKVLTTSGYIAYRMTSVISPTYNAVTNIWSIDESDNWATKVPLFIRYTGISYYTANYALFPADSVNAHNEHTPANTTIYLISSINSFGRILMPRIVEQNCWGVEIEWIMGEDFQLRIVDSNWVEKFSGIYVGTSFFNQKELMNRILFPNYQNYLFGMTWNDNDLPDNPYPEIDNRWFNNGELPIIINPPLSISHQINPGELPCTQIERREQ